MKKEDIKVEIWQELDDYQAEVISGGLENLQRLTEEFDSVLAKSSKPKEIVVVGSKIS